MAIMIEFERVREDSQQVEYLFGPPDTANRRLVIEKATGQGRPLDGNRDPAFAGAFVKIVRSYRHEASWPEKGMYAA